MLSEPRIFWSAIKTTALSLSLGLMICICFNSFAGKIVISENQTKIFQAASSKIIDIINVSNPGVPAIAFEIKSKEKAGYNFQNKNIFKSVSFSDHSKNIFFNYLRNRLHSLKPVSLRLHLALGVLLI